MQQYSFCWKYIQDWTKDVPENATKEHVCGLSPNSLTCTVFPHVAHLHTHGIDTNIRLSKEGENK